MGLFKGVKSAVRRVGGRRIKETNREKKDKRTSKPANDGGGLAEEEKAPPESEPPDKPAFKLQPYAESVEDSFEPETQTDPQPQAPSELPLQRPSDYLPPQEKLQGKQPPLPGLQTQFQLDIEPQPSFEPTECGSDCDCDLETDEEDLSEVDLDRGPDSRTTDMETPVSERGLQQNLESASQGEISVEPYRFPFQSGGGPEDQQSFYSGADKAPSPKASSYRGHGRVDSHASPIVDDLRHNPSIRAEVVRERRVSRDELRRPTLRSQREPPTPEQPQYHEFGGLDRASDQESLFTAPRRKLSDEPVSPTSRPEKEDMAKTWICNPPAAMSVIDPDLGSSHDATVSGTELSKSGASSDAESEISRSVLTVPRRPERRTRPVSMPSMQERRVYQERGDSFDSLRSAEWMKGGPPLSFYRNPEKPAGPAGPHSHIASYSLRPRYGSASVGNLYQSYSPAKRPPVRRGRASHSAVPSSVEIERRIAKAKEGKRQDEIIKRGLDQLDEERRRQKREKEIFAGRIAELEYEKCRLAMRHGEISLKNGELEKTVANISTRFLEQRRKLTELEMRQRGWEDFEAQLKNDAHGLLTPPDTASSRSTPGNPDRVIAWAETLADSPLVTTETPAAPDALQKHEATHEVDASGRTLDETVINTGHELPDPTSTKSSSDFSALPNQPHHDSQPEMSVECTTQPQALPSAHKMPGIRLHTLKPATPIYSQSNNSAATFGSEQQPCHRPEPGPNDEQARNKTHNKDSCQRLAPPPAASRQTSQSSLRYHNGRSRPQPKQVQFNAAQGERAQKPKNTQDSVPIRSQDIVERLVKQQQKPFGRQVSPPITQHPAHRNQILPQQRSNPRLASYPNVAAVNSFHTVQPQAYNMNSHQYYQQQQPGYYESQVTPAQQWHMHAPRQNSTPANIPLMQHHQSPLRHAYSSSQLQPSVHPQAMGGFVPHAQNAPHPEPLRRPSQQTLQPPRPSTSHGGSRPAFQSSRPSTSHGRSQPPAATARSLYPPRPGTSNSTRAATFGSSTVPPLPPIRQHPHYQATQAQPQPQQAPPPPSQHQHQTRGGGTGAAAPTAPPSLLATDYYYASFLPHARGTSARSNDTANSHSTALSRMQHKARAGLAENERANAEKLRAAAAEKQQQQRRRGGSGADTGNTTVATTTTTTTTTSPPPPSAPPPSSASPHPSHLTTGSVDQQPQWDPEPVVWGRDLVGEGVIAAQEEAARLWREKERREHERRREVEDRRIRLDMERLAREKMRSVFA